jgi:predicted lipid-binding transport protein (Tim44 family)
MSIRPLIVFGAALAAIVLIVGDLNARPSSGGSFGSRGSRTLSSPSTTPTAPNAAAPIQRTATQPSTIGTGTGIGSGLFNRPGLVGGLFAGFLGAGLLGMLFGHGLFGGLGGFASVLGLIIQVALVVIVGRLIWTWWQRRQGFATASGPALRDIGSDSRANGAAAGGSSAFGNAGGKVVIGKSDYDDFERLLTDVSLAYGEENIERLRTLATPEMAGYFSEQLAGNLSRGVVNKISGLKLLQGDLAEAWREGDAEYATVDMRYAINDTTVERAAGRVVEGADTPQEVTEVWTFVRMRGGAWVLSAIQQTT